MNRNVEGKPWASIGVHKRPGGYSQIKLTLSATVAYYLRLCVGDKVHLERGTGEHQGWVRVTKRKQVEDDGHTVTDSSRNCTNGNISVRVSGRFLALDEPHKTERFPDVVPIDQDGRRYVAMELPAWANREEAFNPWHS